MLKKKMTTTIAMLAVLVLASSAAAVMIVDSFNDGVAGGNWKRTIDKIRVKEQGGKLKTKSDMPGGGDRFSGYKGDAWKLVFTENFTITMNYEIEPPALAGSRKAGVGFRFIPSGEIDEVRIMVQQTRTQLRVWYEAIAGNQSTTRKAVINADEGQLKVRYKKGPDRLDILINGEVVKQIHNFLEGVNVGNGQTRVEVGAFRTGPAMWNWNDVTIDRAVISGQILD